MNLSGQLVGYQQYRPHASKEMPNNPREGRYFTRLKDNKVGVWGLESYNNSQVLFLTEGIFDAARLSFLGYAAVAVLSFAVNAATRQWLYAIRSSRPVVAVCDADASGRKLAKFGSAYHVVTGYKDLGDASDNYVKQLVAHYS